MVSKRYRCAIYSDLEDDEDDADFAYESEEEEFSDPKEMEDDSVSAMVEISNCDFIFGSFGHESTLDIVQAIPIKTVKQEIEGSTVNIGQITCSFAIKSETRTRDHAFSFLDPETKTEKYETVADGCAFSKLRFERVLQVPNHFLYSKNLLPSSNLFRRSYLEFGNLSPTAVSSPEAIDSAKPSKFSSFSFDPGGALKDAGYTAVRYSDFFLDPPYDTLILLSTDLIEKCIDLTFAKPVLVFDPGGSLIVDFVVVQHLLHVAMKEEDELFSDLISPKIIEDPILVFDPGGSHAVDNSVVVMFAFSAFSDASLMFDWKPVGSSSQSLSTVEG